MNQGKLEVVKQEMARVNINILAISELKWTGMGEFYSDAHYTTGEEQRNSSRRIEEAEPKRKQCPIVDVSGDKSSLIL